MRDLAELTRKADSSRRRESQAEFSFLVTGSLVCSTAYTLLQERLFRCSQHRNGVTTFQAHGWLTFLTFATYAVFSAGEMAVQGKLKIRKGNLIHYASVALISMVAVYLTNFSLHSVPYTAKIVVKSCRVLPVMLLSVALQKRQYSIRQYVTACSMAAGVMLFFSGDWAQLTQSSGDGRGLSLLLVALLLDAVVANLEERLLLRGSQAACRVEVMMYLSAFGSLFSFMAIVATGEISLAWSSVPHSMNPALWVGMLLSALAGYGAMNFMLALIQAYGVTTTEVVKTMRKVMQVTLSFAVFPKPITSMHMIGGAVTIASLIAFSRKEVRPKAKASPKVVDGVPDDFEFAAWKGRSTPYTSSDGLSFVEEPDEVALQSGLTVKWSAA